MNRRGDGELMAVEVKIRIFCDLNRIEIALQLDKIFFREVRIGAGPFKAL